jgi:hypothetical protein
MDFIDNDMVQNGPRSVYLRSPIFAENSSFSDILPEHNLPAKYLNWQLTNVPTRTLWSQMYKPNQ